MTARRIATAISHELHRTRALISFMIGAGKLFAAGMDDTREQTYGLTDHGVGLARAIEGAGQHTHKHDVGTSTDIGVAAPPAPAHIPETDTARPASIKHDPRPLEPLPDRRNLIASDEAAKPLEHHQAAPVRPQQAPQASPTHPAHPSSRVRFGMLNTGDLMFISPADLMITLPSDDIAVLRDMIKAQP